VAKGRVKVKLHKGKCLGKIRGKGRVSRDLETTQRKADKGLTSNNTLSAKVPKVGKGLG